jgi:hypothetical protein
MIAAGIVSRVERRGVPNGLARRRDDDGGPIRTRDHRTTSDITRRDADVNLPRRYDMSEMTQDMARDRMRQMRRDMEVARGMHGRYAVRQRPRRAA